MTAFLYITAALAFVLAAYLVTGSALPRNSRHFLAAVFVVIAALTSLAALQISESAAVSVVLRPVLAMTLPALLYLHIITATRVQQSLRLLDAIHVLGPLGVAIMSVYQWPGQWLDGAIVIAHIMYLLLIAWSSRKGKESFAGMGAKQAMLFNRWSKLVQVFLLFAVLSDTIIMFELAGNANVLARSWGMAVSSLVLACGMAWLLIAGLHRTGPLTWAAMQVRSQSPGQQRVIEQLEHALLTSSAYLDPNLSLKKFSRKVGLPVRDVSAAINDQRQCNYNQWLNGFRIREVQRIMLSQPESSLTEVMFAAGFQNKSTFNAAFRLLQGESPSDWRARMNGNDHAPQA